MAQVLFADLPSTTVSSGGTTAPGAGTQETWTVASSASFPAVTTGTLTQFHVADTALTAELIAVTNISGTTWTVIRGSDGTAPVAHTTGFTVRQTVAAGTLGTLWQNAGTGFAYAMSLSRQMT